VIFDESEQTEACFMNLCRLLYHNTDGKIIAEITKTTIINIFIILEYIS
jgi:hypothetical protein